MLKLDLTTDYLKRLVLQNHFHRGAYEPQNYDEYEAYFILDEEGEPHLIIEEAS